MNSMFDRLGERLKNYLENMNTDVFSNVKQEDLIDEDEEQPVESGWHYTYGEDEKRWQDIFSENLKRQRTQNSTESAKPTSSYGRTEEDKGYKRYEYSYFEKPKPAPVISAELQRDFLKLGVPIGAPLEDCKAAQIKLLKTYHPDKFPSNSFEQNKATVMSALVNESFQRIKEWYEAK